jgi:glycosyltransferase involved in cell wall biosynthesis
LSEQLIAKYPILRHLSGLLNFFEWLAVRHAEAVVPVCEALTLAIAKYKPKRVLTLHDVSLLGDRGHQTRQDLRVKLGITAPLLMYVGNLEVYQGIDLLLESFALALKQVDGADLLIIGGEASDIRNYQAKCRDLRIQERVRFLGPRPVEDLAGYLAEADVLVAPRIAGSNTPMKLYSYLDSGKPVIATNLPTHTQVLGSHAALLAHPNPQAFSNAILQLLKDRDLGKRLGTAGKRLIEDKYTYAAFRIKLNALYDWLRHTTHRKRDVALLICAIGGSALMVSA